MNGSGGPLLPSPDPHSWLAEHLAAHQARHDQAHAAPEAEMAGPARWVTLSEVTADGGAAVARVHAAVCEQDQAPAQVVAKWVASWFGGSLAAALAFTRLYADAAVLVTAQEVRFRLHPDGWPDRVELRPHQVMVPAGHPWVGGTGVVAAPEADRVDGAILEQVVELVTPVLAAVGRLARVGRRSLWLEVVDEMGLTLTHAPRLPVDAGIATRLRALLERPGAPWTKGPEVLATAGPAGPLFVGRKAGCCLAYELPEPEQSDETPTPYQLEYQRRFPVVGGERRTCGTCSLRTLEDCTARQLFWAEHRMLLSGH